MSSCFGKHDPGPCPVDDTPHTACTPADVELRVSFRPQGTVTTTTPTPTQVLELRAQAQARLAAAPPVSFSTKTYRRALHGRPKR